MNMILGPGPSSVATRVMGTGLLENLGIDAWRERLGRSERTDDGRSLEAGLGEAGSLRDVGLLPEASEDAFNEVARFEMNPSFLLGGSWRSKASSGEDVVVLGSESNGLRVVRSGTLTSFSPVDFFDGGGPLIESPWLFRRRINFL